MQDEEDRPRTRRTLAAALALALPLAPALPADEDLRKALEDRLEGREASMEALGLDAAGAERLLRAGPPGIGEPPQPRGTVTLVPRLDCAHVDYATSYYLYVPKAYDPSRPWPLVIAGHGGASVLPRELCAAIALDAMHPVWTAEAEAKGFLVAAPLSERGWGAIGNSILLSLVSKLQREYRIDPDRIHVTGHSMGGHLAWRSALHMPDRWGAVGPMSGGYDYVASGEVRVLFDVPGLATWGTREPYGIREHNRAIRAWTEARGYPWVHCEREGGHAIFPDTLPRMAQFFLDHPRDLYRKRVYARGQGHLAWDKPETDGRWGVVHAWRPDRPIPKGSFHWLRLFDAADPGALQEVLAENRGGNRIEILSRNARRLRVYLHPRMVDFDKPVTFVVNGKTAFQARVAPDLKTMMALVREFDDRGRIFHAAVDLEIGSDAEVPAP